MTTETITLFTIAGTAFGFLLLCICLFIFAVIKDNKLKEKVSITEEDREILEAAYYLHQGKDYVTANDRRKRKENNDNRTNSSQL